MAKKPTNQGEDWRSLYIKESRTFPDYVLCEILDLSPSYFPKWVRKNGLPHQVIAGTYWIHVDDISGWIRGGSDDA